MSAEPLVLYHSSCMDGYAAACVVARYAGGEGDYKACQYGEPLPPDIDGREVFVVDFSFPEPEMIDLIKRAKLVTWIDHHKGVEDLFNALKPSLSALSAFSLTECGATLTWKQLMNGPVPPVLEQVRIRDLWLWDSLTTEAQELAREVDEATRVFFKERWSKPQLSYDELLGFFSSEEGLERLSDVGSMLLKSKRQRIHAVCRGAVPFMLRGHKALAVNATTDVSEVGEELLTRPGVEVAVIYFATDTGWVHSLRSRGETDVCAVAKLMGGGGHLNAAGYRHEKPIILALEEHGATRKELP